MLMIRRRCGESILLGDDIEIHVLEVTGSRVKLGISAPRDVLVLRNELRLTEEFNREASQAVPPTHLLSLAATMLKSRSGMAKGLNAGGSRRSPCGFVERFSFAGCGRLGADNRPLLQCGAQTGGARPRTCPIGMTEGLVAGAKFL